MAAIMVLLRGWVLANVRAWGPAVLDVTRLLDVGDPFVRAADFILPGASAVLAAFGQSALFGDGGRAALTSHNLVFYGCALAFVGCLAGAYGPVMQATAEATVQWLRLPATNVHGHSTQRLVNALEAVDVLILGRHRCVKWGQRANLITLPSPSDFHTHPLPPPFFYSRAATSARRWTTPTAKSCYAFFTSSVSGCPGCATAFRCCSRTRRRNTMSYNPCA
jgi:hypothetical protein